MLRQIYSNVGYRLQTGDRLMQEISSFKIAVAILGAATVLKISAFAVALSLV
jgi:hypothetical protein